MKAVKRFFLLISTFCIVSGILIAFGLKGEPGATGFALGTIATVSNFFGLWMAIGIIGADPSKDPAVIPKLLLRALAFLTSLPIFLVCMRRSHALGPVADGCFIGGLALVYLMAISWGVLRVQLD